MDKHTDVIKKRSN